MCAISGWFLKDGRSRPAAQLQAMMKSMNHRGPDDQGMFIDRTAGVALGHNRLSIIDLSQAGHQPMISDDGNTVLVFNGEIYNFCELREGLKIKGYHFKSHCDTEVVLHAFSEWGIDCINRFCGMFAFAVWSAKDKKLFLVRDPMGIKPLYYSFIPNGQGLVFASEIKAFLTLPDFNVSINQNAVQQFLEFGYIFDKDKTSFEGVFKLPPGHILEAGNGIVDRPRAFFFPPAPYSRKNLPLHEREEELYNILAEVVSQHLVADVPVGLLLSGGLDSSLIAAIASKEKKVTTVSMRFAESRIDETAYARTVSKYIGSDHHEVVVTPHELIQSMNDVVWYYDDLFADWGLVSTRLLYEKCRGMGIKVVVVGEGADEIFGGYLDFSSFSFDTSFKPVVWKLFQLYRRYAGRRYGNLFLQFHAMMRKYLKQGKGDFFHALRLFESQNQLPNNYVMKVDKASMSVSVEARTPYLDRRVVELAYQTPRECLLTKSTNKFLLRSMAERYELLPKEIIHRHKYGASMAISWMDDFMPFREYSREVILGRKNGWVDQLGFRRAMTEYFDKTKEGFPFPHSIGIFRNLAWRLLLLNLWSEKYLGKFTFSS